MAEQITTHEGELARLKKIEGQVRGIQKMIEEKRYCIDILTQLASISGAVKRVEANILERHLKGCVQNSFCKGNQADREKKIEEVIQVLQKFGK
jgi:DNA-binding FrmR family transcriptional regulator